MSTAGVPTFSQELALRQGQINAGWELLKLCVGRSEHTFAALLLGMFEKFTLPPSHPAVIKLISMCDELLREIQVRMKLLSGILSAAFRTALSTHPSLTKILIQIVRSLQIFVQLRQREALKKFHILKK
jgi:hypothetical protein